MKLRLLTLIIIILMITPAFSQVEGQHDLDLEWGVEVGDEITYVLQRKYLDEQMGQMIQQFMPFITRIDAGQKVIARVDYLPEIEENSTYSMFSGANCSIIRENDSEILMENMSMFVIPLGIWNMNQSEPNETNETRTQTMFGGFEMYNDTNEWGMTMSGDMWVAIFHIVFNMKILYYKMNGTLNRMEMKVDISGTPSVDILFVQWKPNMATIVPMDFPIWPVIIYSSVGVVVVLIIVFLWRRRRKRVVVQE